MSREFYLGAGVLVGLGWGRLDDGLAVAIFGLVLALVVFGIAIRDASRWAA